MKKSRMRKICQCEIVHVQNPDFLMNSRRQACHYETPDGAPLAAGYYLVAWPIGASRSAYGPELRFFGPCNSAIAAQVLETSALWLGIVASPDGATGCPLPITDHRSSINDHNRFSMAATVF